MSRIAIAVCTSWLVAAPAWAAPAPSAAPLVTPRPGKSDSVRAQERARADSVRAMQPHLSGGQALAVGLSATLVPPAIVLLTNPPGSNSEFAWEASLTVGAALGVFAGPAIGLGIGGRDDLAMRGLLIRGLGYSATLLGLFAVGSSLESSSSSSTGLAVVAVAGLVGAGVSVVSCIYDLAITPSAVGPVRRVSVRPVMDEHGRLAVRARF